MSILKVQKVKHYGRLLTNELFNEEREVNTLGTNTGESLSLLVQVCMLNYTIRLTLLVKKILKVYWVPCYLDC